MLGMKRAFRLIPALEWPLRPVLGIGLGLAFFYAGVQKYLSPYEFAEAILAYQLLPQALVGLTAAIFPPLEMAVGVGLVPGLPVRGPVSTNSGSVPNCRNLYTGRNFQTDFVAADNPPTGHLYPGPHDHHGPGLENRLRLRSVYGSASWVGGNPGGYLHPGDCRLAVLAGR